MLISYICTILEVNVPTEYVSIVLDHELIRRMPQSSMIVMLSLYTFKSFCCIHLQFWTIH